MQRTARARQIGVHSPFWVGCVTPFEQGTKHESSVIPFRAALRRDRLEISTFVFMVSAPEWGELLASAQTSA